MLNTSTRKSSISVQYYLPCLNIVAESRTSMNVKKIHRSATQRRISCKFPSEIFSFRKATLNAHLSRALLIGTFLINTDHQRSNEVSDSSRVFSKSIAYLSRCIHIHTHTHISIIPGRKNKFPIFASRCRCINSVLRVIRWKGKMKKKKKKKSIRSKPQIADNSAFLNIFLSSREQRQDVLQNITALLNRVVNPRSTLKRKVFLQKYSSRHILSRCIHYYIVFYILYYIYVNVYVLVHIIYHIVSSYSAGRFHYSYYI